MGQKPTLDKQRPEGSHPLPLLGPCVAHFFPQSLLGHLSPFHCGWTTHWWRQAPASGIWAAVGLGTRVPRDFREPSLQEQSYSSPFTEHLPLTRHVMSFNPHTISGREGLLSLPSPFSQR